MTATANQPGLRDRELIEWLLHRLVVDRGVGNLASAVSTAADFDRDRLSSALHAVMARRPDLRRTFTGRQITIAAAGGPLPVLESALPEERVADAITSLCTAPLPDGVAMIRIGLLRTSARCVVCLVLHRLSTSPDGVEQALAQVLTAYSETPGRPSPRPVEAPTRPTAASVRYWAAELAAAGPIGPPMATARRPTGRPTFAGDVVRRVLGAEARDALTVAAGRGGTDETAVLLAVAAVLLVQHGAGPNPTIGVPVRCVTGAGSEVPLPLRLPATTDMTFDEVLAAADICLRRARDHADAVDAIPRGVGARWWMPRFRHTVDIRRSHDLLDAMVIDGYPVRPEPAVPHVAEADLHLVVTIGSTGLDLEARYSTQVHVAADVGSFCDRFEALLRHGHNDGVARARLSEADRTLIARVNRTARELPAGSVVDLLLAQARRAPANRAVDATLYRELVAMATGVRDRLRGYDIGHGDVVGVTGPRGARLVAGMLGTWLAGAAYLPVGDDAPNARTRAYLDHAGVTVVVSAAGHRSPLGEAASVVEVAGGDAAGSSDDQEHDYGAGRAYVLFTSGSTGRPKGVAIPHRALVNIVTDVVERLSLRPGRRMLWSTVTTFDISALEVWAPLVAGAQVITGPDDLPLVPEDLLEFLYRKDIHVVQGTPTLWQHLASYLDGRLHGTEVLVGGELLTAPLAEQLLAAGARVHHMYGPTETTIWSTGQLVNSPVPMPVPIGVPLANTQVHVLDERGEAVFPGVPGELAIGGVGVAEGYLYSPSLTRDRFVDGPRGRCYRTGDRVRQLPGGALEFLGRADRQVKIRGHRVEPGEVEAVLGSHLDVDTAAAVTERDPSGRLRLAAVVASRAHAGDAPAAQRAWTAALQRHAAERVARVAVPARIAVVARLPLTPNGKTDYHAVAAVLAAIGTQTVPSAAAPVEPLAAALVQLWRDELGRPDLTVDADFFEHGGSPRQAIELADMATARTGLRVPFDAVFAAPTPEKLYELLIAQEGAVP